MATPNTCETTDVIIVGCGPTGALLSAYLGRASVHNVVLEREPEITTDPRGIALDEDGIRYLQGVGLYDKVFTEIGTCMGRFNFIGGRETRLDKKPFMSMDYSTSEGGTGHPGFMTHKQPVLEKNLRQAMAENGHSYLKVQSTVLSISEDEDWVYTRYADKDGQERRIRGRFLIGADGKTGFTRKHYLEPQGIYMEKVHEEVTHAYPISCVLEYDQIWVAVNLELSLPSPQSHPNFPLWRRGYTPLDVYDSFFPKCFRFLCNPERPAVCGRFGLPGERLWRFEFVVGKDENGHELAEQDNMKRILMPYLTHPGSRYSLPHSVQYPDDCIKVIRSRPFTFSARSCNKWALKRVILCGDSAHVFPPFGGQGIASGFRDASALAWRLIVACRSLSSPGPTISAPTFESHHTRLLTGWYLERKQQLEKSLAATIENGAYVCKGSRLKSLVRDWYLWAIQLIPSWKHWLEMGQRRDGMIRYANEDGVAFLPRYDGGFCFPQVYCVSLAEEQQQEGQNQTQRQQQVHFTDDVIFASHKRTLFQLVVLCPSLAAARAAHNSLASLDSDSSGELSIAETTYIIQDLHAGTVSSTSKDSLPSTSIFRIASADEFAHSKLCVGRPQPRFYDPHRLWKESGGKPFLILRPDHFVFAACKDADELRVATRELVHLLKGDA